VSGLYLYCFTPPGFCPGSELAGLGAHPVSCRTVAGLAVWAEELDGAPEVSVEAIRRHHDVVRAAWALAPACLPVRFGQWLADAGALQETVEEQRAELERALARVTGAGEHGVRISEPGIIPGPSPKHEPQPTSGREYMERLREKVRAQDEHETHGRTVASELEASLEGTIRAQRVDRLTPEQGLVSVSHLVSREREREYAAGISRFQGSHPELEILCTGPWPPYSFAP
jgi:hypothetical protein